MAFTYCTRCYTQSHRKVIPFGFCKDCWEKQGKPSIVKVEEYIEDGKPANK